MLSTFVRNLIVIAMLATNFCFIFTFLSPVILAANYFCNFKCGKEHTVCARPNCETGKECGRYYKMLPFTDEDRSIMLAAHNDRRNHVASGKETRYGNGKASNMNVLSYSKELEYVAQCWANTCSFDADECRSTKRFPGHVGQNRRRFYLNANSNLTGSTFLHDAVFYWYNYITNTNAESIDFLKLNIGTTYTQLVWSKTTHIGCGRVTYGNFADTPTLLIVCNYGYGHLSDEAVYLRGEPCSDCIICNKQYTSLCGEIEDFTKDSWTFPREDYSDVQKPIENEGEILHCHYSNKDL